MTDTKEPEVVAQEIIAKMDEMIKETETLIGQTDEFYKELGVTRGAAKRYLESEKVKPEQKQKVMQELKEWEEEVEREVKEAQERFKMQNRPHKPPKMDRIRI